MDRDRVEQALREQLIEDLFFGDPEARIEADDDLFELGLDSLGVSRLVVFAERRFSARIPDGEVTADNFRSLRVLTALVLRS